jgi:predicted ester cyclase
MTTTQIYKAFKDGDNDQQVQKLGKVHVRKIRNFPGHLKTWYLRTD